MTEPTKEIAPIDRLKNLAAQDTMQKRFKEVLKERAPAFISSIVSAVSQNPALEEVAKNNPMSILSAGMIAATLNLPINASLGWAHIVPYAGAAQFQIGKGGYVQLALRSGQYETIHVTRIYEGQIKKRDQFTGDIEFQEARISDNVIGYLLYFKLLNGYRKFFYMSKEECLAHANKYSKSFNNKKGNWVTDFDGMGEKTVCKLGLKKYGVLSVEMQTAMEVDDAEIDENGRPRSYVDAPEVKDTPFQQASPTSKRLATAVDAKTKDAPVDSPSQGQPPI